MKKLADELLQRFPEIEKSLIEENEELPNCMLHELLDWVLEQSKAGLDEELVQRMVDFQEWCLSQASGESAKDDIFSIYTVALFEKLFRYDETRMIIPKLRSKQELLDNREYLVTWVGEEDYKKVLALY